MGTPAVAASVPGRLLVIACARCRRAKVVERGRKTTTCAVCGAGLKVPQARVLFESEDEEAAREAAGLANARLAGREAEYQRSLSALSPAGPALPATRHEAALRAWRAAPPAARIEAAARALGEFTEEEFASVLADAKAPTGVAAALAQLAARRILVEPRAGRFRLLD